MKRLLITALLSILITSPAYGMTCHDLVMSYVLHDQDKPSKPGDKLYEEGVSENVILMETTAYCCGSHGSHGDRMIEGYCAASPEMYGDVVMVYEAIQQDDGTYRVGEFIDQFEVRDTGYGYPSGDGQQSKIRPDKSSQGTIEKSQHIDVRRDTLSRCRDWMKKTNGKIFVVVIEGKG